MYQINDYSNLNVEEARDKIIHLHHRILAEQFHKSFFVRDPRPEVYLKYEIQAFLEDRIKEFHGWTDPIGQAVEWLYDTLTGWIEDLWKYTVKPFVEDIISTWDDYWKAAVKWAKNCYYRIVEAYNKAVDIYKYLRNTVVGYLSDIWSVVQNISATIYSKAREAVSVVYGWIEDFYDKAKDVWDGIVSTVSGKFEALSKQVAALPQSIASAFQSAISYLKDVFKAVWNDILVPYGKTLAGGLEWIGKQLETVFVNVINSIENIFTAIAPISPERAQNASINALKVAGVAAGGLLAMTAAWDLIHPFKDVIPGELKAMLYDVTNYKMILGALTGALTTAAIAQPMKYYYNSLFQPYLPREDDLKRFLWRGLITEEEYLKYLQYHGFSEKFRRAFLELTKTIPSPSDLVRFVVREVALMPRDYPTPEFFIEAMRKWGYDDYWARAYWWSHWELPAFGQLQEAYFRDIIDRKELEQFIKWHDYSPDPRPGIRKSDLEIMYELIFKMPDKLDARWMRRWGIINSEEHRWLLKADGLHPEWIDRVALAEKMNMLTDERTEIKSAYRSQYLIGLITLQVLQSKLREIFYTPEETEFLIRAAEERYKYELVKDAIDSIRYSYRLGYITKEQMLQQLSDLGISAEKVQRIVAIELARAIETRREALQESIYIYGRDIVIRRFREGITTPDELERELKLIGYQDRQIAHLRTVALLERDYDFAMTVLSTVKRAYKKKKIDDVRFIEILRSFGFTDEKISLELSLLKLELGLGLEGEEVGG